MAGSKRRAADARSIASGDGAVLVAGDNSGNITTTGRASGEQLEDVIFDVSQLESDLAVDRYTGREWIIAELDQFIDGNRSGYFVVEGDAGVGKTALAANLRRTRSAIHHFVDVPGGESPSAARKSLAGQLIRRFGLEQRILGSTNTLPPDAGSRTFLARTLSEVSRSLTDVSDPVLIVVDGVDQAAAEDIGDVDVPFGLPPALPAGIFVVVTARAGLSYSSVREPTAFVLLASDDARNLRDMQEFLAGIDMPASPRDATRSLATRVDGNWMHLRYLLDELRMGIRTYDDIDGLPRSLTQYYLSQVSRWRAPSNTQGDNVDVLRLLAVLRRPVPIEFLMDLAEGQEQAAVEEFLRSDGRPFVRRVQQDGTVHYAIRHQGFRDFLIGRHVLGRNDYEQELLEANANSARSLTERVCAALTPAPNADGDRDWKELTGFAATYRARYLADHAAESGRLDGLVCQASFLLLADPRSILKQDIGPTASSEVARAVVAYRHATTQFETWDGEVDRAWVLHASARIAGAEELAQDALRHTREPWRVARVHGTATTSLRFEFPNIDEGRFLGWLHSVSTFPGIDGAFYVRRDGSVRYLSGRWGEPSHVVCDPHSATVSASTTLMGEPHLLIGCAGGQVIDLAIESGRPVVLDHQHRARVLAVAGFRTRLATVVASAAQDGRLIVQTVAPSEIVFEYRQKGWVTAVTTEELAAGGFAVYWAGSDGVLRAVVISEDDAGRLIATPVEEVWRNLLGDDASDVSDNPYDYAVTASRGGEELPLPDIELPPTSVNSLFSLNSGKGGQVYIGGAAGLLACIDCKTGELRTRYEGHTGAVTGLCSFGGTEARLASSSSDGSVRIWSAETGDCQAVLRGDFEYVSQVAYGAVDGQQVLFAGGSGGKPTAWYLGDIGASQSPWPSVNAVAMATWDEEPAIFAGCADGTIQIISDATGEHLAQLDAEDSGLGAITALRTAVIDGKQMLFAGTSKGAVMQWEGSAAGRRISESGEDVAVETIAVGTHDGKPAVAVHRRDHTMHSHRESITLITLDDYTSAYRDPPGEVRLDTVDLSDSLVVVAGSFHGRQLGLWRPGEEQITEYSVPAENEPIDLACFRDQGQDSPIVFVDRSGAIRVSARPGTEPVELCRCDGPVVSATLAGDGPDRVAAVGSGRVWLLRDACARAYPAHRSVSDVVMTPSGRVYTGGTHPSLIQWEYIPHETNQSGSCVGIEVETRSGPE